MIVRFFFFLFFIIPMLLQTTAQQYADELKAVINSEKPYKQRIQAYLDFGENFWNNDFDETIALCNDGISLARKNGDSMAVASLMRHAGRAWYFKGNYEHAAKNFYAAIIIFERNNEQNRLAATYNELAKLYRKTRDLDRALEYYDKSLSLYRRLNDSTGIATELNESGVVFEYKGDYEEAIRRYSQALQINYLKQDSVGIGYALSFIAGVRTIQGKYDDAEKNLLEALAIRKAMKDSFAMALNYADLGATYKAKGDYAKANTSLLSSNTIAEEMKYAELMSANYSELAGIAEAQGLFKTALEYYQKRTSLRDSIFNIEKTKQIEELSTRYETEKKERLIEQQQFRIRQKNYWMWGAIGLLVLGIWLGYSFYRRYKLKQQTIMQATLMQQQKESARAVLEAEENERQRIARDLHDGVGQMMSVAKMNLSAFESELTTTTEKQKNSLDKIITLVDDSCKEVRSVSHNMMPNALLKNSLAAALKEFIAKLDNKNLEVHLYTEGLDEKFDNSTETILYRVIQECVNNVIRHSAATTVDISLIKDNDGISGTIEDNGKGFDTSDREKFEGIGMRNIITRVEYLNGTVDFDSAPGRGTVVALHIPLLQ